MKLENKSAIVTGAASGIGKEIAFTFAREGASVAIADLNQAAADATAAEIRARGGKAIGVAMDVCNEDAVNLGVAATVEAFGGVDILVSNAGIQIVHPLEAVSVRRLEEDAGDPSRWRLPDDQGLPAAHVQVGPRRQRDLHGLGALEGGVASSRRLRHGQARADRPGQGRRQGRRASTACTPT